MLTPPIGGSKRRNGRRREPVADHCQPGGVDRSSTRSAARSRRPWWLPSDRGTVSGSRTQLCLVEMEDPRRRRERSHDVDRPTGRSCDSRGPVVTGDGGDRVIRARGHQTVVLADRDRHRGERSAVAQHVHDELARCRAGPGEGTTSSPSAPIDRALQGLGCRHGERGHVSAVDATQ